MREVAIDEVGANLAFQNLVAQLRNYAAATALVDELGALADEKTPIANAFSTLEVVRELLLCYRRYEHAATLCAFGFRGSRHDRHIDTLRFEHSVCSRPRCRRYNRVRDHMAFLVHPTPARACAAPRDCA